MLEKMLNTHPNKRRADLTVEVGERLRALCEGYGVEG
jgi:hypothetical protein